MIPIDDLIARWQDTPLQVWGDILPEQVAQGMSLQRYGDLPRWQDALNALPALEADVLHLNASRVGASSMAPISDAQRQQLHDALQGLHPWRKGPFELFGLHIDTEWRSDWKWERVIPHIEALAGRRVLDVGCGSGYHCWRMLGEGAGEVIGIDPTPLFVLQFQAIQRYLQQPDIWVLPLGIEHVPQKLQAFDSVFSMGILYHRRSPMDHLQELKDCLRPGGQLILETLVVEGDLGTTLVPEGRYARMGNVWFLPSCDTLISWLKKIGFQDPAVVDVGDTTLEEQRSTDWMRFHSLAQFLDPNDPSKSIEGYPAPRRAVFTASMPGAFEPQL